MLYPLMHYVTDTNKKVPLSIQIAFLLILNQALLLCEELQAFPITDDPVAHQGLLIKLDKLYSSSEIFIRSALPKPVASDLYQIQSFTMAVISRLIPEEAFDKLSISEVIEFRENNTDSLQRFKEKMVELASEISAKPWSSDFNTQVLALIDSKITPEVRKLDDELRDSYKKLFGVSIGKLSSEIAKVAAPAIPTMTMATFLGLTSSQITLLGAASIMSGLGIVLPDIIDTWQDRRTHRKNGLSFLLNLKNTVAK
jgi:hypothetical protein